ncbi:hypothetical protein [Desulforhopalus singaporensis]|uniref:Uncharacterized protein n=1 Tax=Desulforhopalus singaporensis TaxID=91360 RepID=A0A1H0U5M5_9BACT|nr:hypothetical protein [Desulforhopalus singaporensis]SDP61459.1 hypothetical protein SAMN05660330_03390 [Desulforhopalus singaporensis]
MVRLFIIFFAVVLTLGGCNTSPNNSETKQVGCIDCHHFQLDDNHNFACTVCHQGSDSAADKQEAHQDLIALPAHPDNMAASCGTCHESAINNILKSAHYTLKNSVNRFRRSFGAKEELVSLLKVPDVTDPSNILELADDLLRSRCLRCHLFTAGDDYPATHRGTGCSACHLRFSANRLTEHRFTSATDEACLACHYGNYVGADYYGWYEHDFSIEFRTPYTTTEEYLRPYGVEFHQLRPDIHKIKKLQCLDCHSGEELMGGESNGPSCGGCHSKEELASKTQQNITAEDGNYFLHAKDGTIHPVPLLRHPAHYDRDRKISCQACHAQWTFNDLGKHFLRSDTDNYDIFANLSVQGSSEIEKLVDNNNDFDQPELPIIMIDKLTGQPRQGVWYKGFTTRRWENVTLGRDQNGVITTVRPLLDYRLSWIDENDVVRFNSVAPRTPGNGFFPYVPHTTGAAGLFYQERIRTFLTEESSATGD